jgi:nucleotide-binding universal stress UspA family protein
MSELTRKIILATDFNQGANTAIGMALYLASRFRGEVVVVHVLPRRGILAPIAEDLERQTRDRLAAIRGRLEAGKVQTVAIRMARGEPHEEIVAIAESRGASLIVLGSGRTGTSRRPRLGITAERVIRRSPVPVLVMRSGDPLNPRRILCPVDTSHSSDRALRHAIRLAERFDAHLDVMHVVRPLASLVPQAGGHVDQQLEEEHFTRRTAAFSSFLRELEFENVRWARLVSRGEPADLILARARDARSDLMVMGTVGRTGPSRIQLGSVTAQVVRAFPCSLLAVKIPDAGEATV